MRRQISNVFRTNKLNTAMASYLIARETPASLLASKGLFSQLVPDARFAAGHRFIAPVHAGLAFAMAGKLLTPSGDRKIPHPEGIIASLLVGKFTKSGAELVKRRGGAFAMMLQQSYAQFEGPQPFHPCCSGKVSTSVTCQPKLA